MPTFGPTRVRRRPPSSWRVHARGARLAGTTREQAELVECDLRDTRWDGRTGLDEAQFTDVTCR